MTNIQLFYDRKGLRGFEAAGHSGYAEEGSDIVCASISSALYLVANTITDVMGIPAEAEADETFRLLTTSFSKEADILLQGLKLHLNALESDYPKFLHVQLTEV